MKITLFSSSLHATHGRIKTFADSDDIFEYIQQTHEKEKGQLPQFSPCTFEDDSRARGKKRISLSMLVLDMDSKEKTVQPKKLNTHLNRAKVSHLIYTTSSHTPEKPRYRVIIPLATPIPADAWKRFVPAAIAKCKLKDLWPFLDHCTLSAASIYRLAPASSIFFSGKHAPLSCPIPPEPKQKPAKKLELSDQDAYVAAAINGEIKKISEAKKGERNHTLNASAYALGQLVGSSDLDYAVALEHLTEAALSAGLPDFEARRVIKRGLDDGAGNPRKSHKQDIPDINKNEEIDKPDTPITVTPSDILQPDQDDMNYMGSFIRTQKGALKNCEYNAIHAFMHPALVNIIYYNEFSSRVCVDQSFLEIPWNRPDSIEWTDIDDVEMSAWLQMQKIQISSGSLGGVVNAVAHRNARHPVRDYLNGLEWDNVDRIDTWLTDYLGAPLTAYSSSVGTMWLVSAVARIYVPGCQADHMLVLEGPQGEGKSTALRNLAGEWFTDELPDLGSKDAAINISGRWIIEMSELDSFRRAEAEAARAFISRRVDRYRPPYAHRARDFPRQNVFVGTTNSTSYLKDSTGNRRYWPILCGTFEPAKVESARDQIWAESLARYRNNEKWWPSAASLIHICREEVAARNQAHPWAEIIEDFLLGQDEVGVDAILADIAVPTERRTQGQLNTIAGIMQNLGWARRRRRINGRPVWRYIRSEMVHGVEIF